MDDVFEHWHPVARASQLRDTPLKISLHAREIVLFRTTGGIGAVDNLCPHRNMQLAHGRVSNDRLVCPLHGWAIDAHGHVAVPTDGGCKTRHRAYETRDAHGLIWIRRTGSRSHFPNLATKEYEPTIVGQYEAPVSLETMLDLYTEAEHTASVHLTLGYDFDRIREFHSQTLEMENSIRTINHGPQKFVPSPIRFLMRGKAGDTFFDEWVTHFSPVYNVYQHHWLDQKTGERKEDHPRYYMFFVPNEALRTTCFLVGFYFHESFDLPLVGRHVVRPVFRRLFRHLINRYADIEMQCDMKVLRQTGNPHGNLSLMNLGRHDHGMLPRRRYLNRIYYGLPSGQVTWLQSASHGG